MAQKECYSGNTQPLARSTRRRVHSPASARLTSFPPHFSYPPHAIEGYSPNVIQPIPAFLSAVRLPDLFYNCIHNF
ncbi:hypothetical protein CcaverHIS641_0104630 [Cutaneotrichosporon cavernicola]|nr:hypothetical protein CcaverHIS641_0104630 [Cutaneotrichosporon cavernicola]